MKAGDVLTTSWDDIAPLRDPVFLIALRGWFDVSSAATSAIEWCVRDRVVTVVGSIDPDPFFDFTQARPEVRNDEDGDRQLHWPENEFSVIRYPEGSRDLVVLNGIEPHLAWPTFVNCIIEVVRGLGIELVVSLGAAAEQVPHTRVPFVVGSTTNPDLAARLGLTMPRYQGPTGVAGVMLEAFDRANIPNVSLRVGVPHYLMSAQHPKSAAALLQHLQHVLGVPTDHANLVDEINRFQELHDSAVEDNEQLLGYIDMLERRHDQMTERMMPTGDDLAAELEAFLRDNDDN